MYKNTQFLHRNCVFLYIHIGYSHWVDYAINLTYLTEK